VEEPFRYKGSLLFVVKKFASFVIRFTANNLKLLVNLFVSGNIITKIV